MQVSRRILVLLIAIALLLLFLAVPGVSWADAWTDGAGRQLARKIRKQSELTGSLLRQWLSGYAFLFPTALDRQGERQLPSQLLPGPQPLVLGCGPGAIRWSRLMRLSARCGKVFGRSRYFTCLRRMS